MEAVVAIGALIVGFASLFAAYKGWRALLISPRLRGKPLADIRQMANSAGRFVLVLMVVALVVGLIGGCWLSARVQEGKERHLEQREKR